MFGDVQTESPLAFAAPAPLATPHFMVSSSLERRRMRDREDPIHDPRVIQPQPLDCTANACFRG